MKQEPEQDVSQHDLAVQLLNDCKLASEGPDKVDILKQLSEILLFRAQHLIEEFVPEIVELLTEPKPVPLYVVELMEALVKAKAHVTVIDHALICMQSLLSDAIVANVRKAAILASVTIFKAAFGVAAHAGTSGSSSEVVKMWKAMCSLKASIQALMTSPTASDSVKHMAMKFVEQAVLMYSAEEHPFLSAGSSMQMLQLVKIPRPHPFLSAAQVTQEAIADFGALLELLKPPQMQDPKGSTVILAMKAVVNIFQRRPRLLGRGMSALLTASTTKTVNASVQNNLKTCLLTMLKHPDPAAVPWRKKIADALTNMGEGEAAKTELRRFERQARKGRQPPGSAAPEPDAKRMKPDPETAGPAGPSSSVHATQQSAQPAGQQTTASAGIKLEDPDMTRVTTLADLARHAGYIARLHAQGDYDKLDQMLKTIPAGVLADAVFDNMARIPSPEAVGAHSGAQSSALFARMLKQGLGGRGPSPAPAATPPHSAFATPPQEQPPAKPSAKAQSPIPGPPAVKGEGQAQAMVASGQGQLVKRVVDPALAQRPKALGLEAAGGMRQLALQRIVQASRTPLRDFRAALLGRLAVKVGEKGSLGDDLLDHILSDFNSGGGYELAMHWLFSLFAQQIPVQAPSSAPEQLQQARASLSGTFSGFHPVLPDPQAPVSGSEALAGSGHMPSQALSTAQEPHASMDVVASQSQPGEHAQHSSKAGPSPMETDSPEQAPRPSDSKEAAAGPSSQDAPEASAHAASSKPAGKANEHPEVVKGQTAEDVQHKLEGQGGADQAQTVARREQGLPMQDTLAEAGGLEGEEAAVSSVADSNAPANSSRRPNSAPAAAERTKQAEPLLDDRPLDHPRQSGSEPEPVPRQPASTDAAAMVPHTGELAVSPAGLMDGIGDVAEDMPEAAMVSSEGPLAEQRSLALQDTLYETVLIAILEGLREMVPEDNGMQDILLDAPCLPHPAVLNFLGRLRKDDEARGSQALKCAAHIIKFRPANRMEALPVILDAAVGPQPQVRLQAILRIGSHLLPKPGLAPTIKAFAASRLKLLHQSPPPAAADQPPAAAELAAQPAKPPAEDADVTLEPDPTPAHADEYNPQEVRARAEARARQACSLYVSLVPRTTGMLQGLLQSYALADPISRKVLEQLGDSLAVALKSTNPELLAAVVGHPAGSEPLLLSMLVKLTEAPLKKDRDGNQTQDHPPPSELVVACKDAFHLGQDSNFLVPVMGALSSQEVLSLLPHLIPLETARLQQAFDRLMRNRPDRDDLAVDMLVKLVKLDGLPKGFSRPDQRECVARMVGLSAWFGAEHLAKAINQLAQMNPLPVMFMRLLIGIVQKRPRTLHVFMADKLAGLISQNIWTQPSHWKGWLILATQLAPASYPTLLQLPVSILHGGLTTYPGLKPKVPELVRYAQSAECKVVVPSQMIHMLDSQASSGSAGRPD
ncbi:hypothetical protein WJX74_006723 [Apatococcus lobatus]|uniref:Symplekin n=1 Tax=Apatococcus lobatus TaxID=904363 RepID=A0AAW1RC50_9CHLO